MFSKPVTFFRIIPALCLSVFFGLLIFRANEGIAPQGGARSHCDGWGWKERQTSDVIFLGSSRTFRGIDPYALTQKLENSNGPYQSANVVWNMRGSLEKKISAFLSLTEGKKPVPKVLIVENSFRKTDTDNRAGRKVSWPQTWGTEKNHIFLGAIELRYFDLNHMSFLKDASEKELGIGWKTRLKRSYQSKYDLAAAKLVKIVYDVLETPSLIFRQREDRCQFMFERWNMLEDETRYERHTNIVGKKKHKQTLKRALKLRPMDPTDESRAYEVVLMNILIKEAKKRGVEEVYVWFPNDYSLRYSQKDFEAFKTAYANVDGIIYEEIVDVLSASKTQKFELFRDANHVSPAGREILTDFWFEFLTK